MNIYVGNLSFDVTEQDLQEAFEAFGEVASVKIIKDKYSGQSKGFGFVEMPKKADGESAINSLKEKELKGRKLNVNEARPRSGGGRQGGRGQGSGRGQGGARRGGKGQGGGGWDGGRRSW